MDRNSPSGAHYTTAKYIKFVENIDDTKFKDYMAGEIKYLKNIEGVDKKVFVDLGAGYGRIEGDLAKIGCKVIAIENNRDMFKELKRRCLMNTNTEAVFGDVNQLDKMLANKNIKNPIFLIMQNTLGIFNDRDERIPKLFLTQLKKVAESLKGEVLISVFKGEKLSSYGVNFYAKLEPMVGRIDVRATEKTNKVKNPAFVSETGYVSNWYTSYELSEIKEILGGRIKNQFQEGIYRILHISYE